MVAGKVRAAMGLHKSSPKPKPPPTSQQPSSSLGPTNPSPAGGGVFSRSFGGYFPKSSAQVQPRPPEVSDLLRLVDELRDRENRLKTELLEFKLLRESVAIVPVLEKQLEEARSNVRLLEAENQRLRTELEEERKAAEEKVKAMEAVILEASSKPCLVRNYSNKKGGGGGGVSGSVSNYCKLLSTEEKREMRHSRSDSEELVPVDSASHIIVKSRAPRVPKPPPPKRSVSSSSSSPPSSSSSGDDSDEQIVTVTVTQAAAPSSAPPPPPPPPPRRNVMKKVPVPVAAAPPPPPPPPMKKGANSQAKVRRIPEVVEFYHSLMRRESRKDAGAEVVLTTANARDMIGEIENRSAHLLAIKTDVETQGDFIRFLIKEVEEAAFTDIEDVVPFVKWLDDELSYLVDERAVLKHFDWPEQKADALREAAFGYCDLKKLESEASSFRDDARQPCGPALKKMQALLEKLEHGVYNLSRMRESASTRYKGFRIPMNWMLETGNVSQIKLGSVKLAMQYMKRVSAELESVGGGPEEEELIVQGVRFAFRVHQFAGGFDVETMRAFQELRDKVRSCHVQCQNQQQQKLLSCKSMAC